MAVPGTAGVLGKAEPGAAGVSGGRPSVAETAAEGAPAHISGKEGVAPKGR